jgi:hypothetical protein
MKSIWFSAGFSMGLIMMSLVQASLPNRATPPTAGSKLDANPEVVTELHAAKVTGPNLDADFARLEQAEARYAEPLEQQQRLRAAVGSNDEGQGRPSKRR